MAAAEPEIHVSQLVDIIESKFQIPMFSRMANSMALGECSPTRADVENTKWPPLNRKISFKFKTLLSEHVVVL